jgi:hypothetical protein
MADVPHELVAGRPEGRVQRDRQLDHAEAGANVSAGVRADVDEAGAHLVRERAELVAAEGAHVGGGMDLLEQCHGQAKSKRCARR